MDETTLLQQDPKSLTIDQMISRLGIMEVEVPVKRKTKIHYIQLYQDALQDDTRRKKLLDNFQQQSSIKVNFKAAAELKESEREREGKFRL
jgi:hypothetical protein